MKAASMTTSVKGHFMSRTVAMRSRPLIAGIRPTRTVMAVMLGICVLWPGPITAEDSREAPSEKPAEALWPVSLQTVPMHPAPYLAPKRPGIYTREDWRLAVDQTWGPGRPAAEQLAIFDHIWNTIDMEFACFTNIPDRWDELRDLYRPEVAGGVSKGRLCAIVNQLMLSLRESHTHAYDKDVVFTNTVPGVPLLRCGGYGQVGFFGAALTPLPDKSLLVYDVASGQALGLEKGDIVLGYDGVPWCELYPQLLAAELPILGMWGCSASAHEHIWLMSAGMNWHLFDSIDVLKHATGQIESYPTYLMVGRYRNLWATEQMLLPGVPRPNWNALNVVTHGRYSYEGRQYGYIYVWAWAYDAEVDFRNAIQTFLNDIDQLTGLIIDFRFNMGGNMFTSNPGLSLLFGSQPLTVDFVERYNEHHLNLREKNAAEFYRIPGDGATFFDKPIAVLVGPVCVSSGDQVALRMRYHPKVRIFGCSTSSAFNSAEGTGGVPGTVEYDFKWARAEACLANRPWMTLTHTEFGVQEPCWHTREAVIAGRDAVVESACEWMQSLVPTCLAALAAECTRQGVQLKWRLPTGYAPLRLVIEREAANGCLTRLEAICASPPGAQGELLDSACRPGESYLYQLEATVDDGCGAIAKILSNKLFVRYLEPETGASRHRLVTIEPNPANPCARIRFQLSERTRGRLALVDISGRLVREFSLAHLQAGENEIVWDGTDSRGAAVASGIYQVLLETETGRDVGRISLIK
jgi:hypothetical protein